MPYTPLRAETEPASSTSFFDDRGLTGLTVLMGGGRKWFLPNVSDSISPQPVNGSQRRTANDYVLPLDIVAGWGAAPGALDSGRDLILDFQKSGFAYAADKTDLDSVGVPDKLLGLFAYSNMNVAFDKIGKRRGTSTVVDDYGFPDQPMLDEMTEKALAVLSKRNGRGFVLMVEGASIDKQAHLMDSDRWILDTIELDRAVAVARDFAKRNPDTLVIVTADHECGGAAIIGSSIKSASQLQAIVEGNDHSTKSQRDSVVGVYETAKFPAYTAAAIDDGYPETTDIDGKMLIGYGANADRYETWLSNPQPTRDTQQPFNNVPPLDDYPVNPSVRNSTKGFLVTGQVAGEQAVHTAADIPLSAYGRGSSLFAGVLDNTDVFFRLGQAALGGAKNDSHRDWGHE